MEKRSPTCILCADMHLRETRPRNRIDDYFAAQVKKVEFIKDLQDKHGIPVLDAGDIFHKWDSSPFLEAWAIENLPHMTTIPGNHELPSHNINNLKRSSLHVLEAAKKITLITNSIITYQYDDYNFSVRGFFWGCELKARISSSKKRKVALVHAMVTDEKLKYKDKTAIRAHSLLDKLPEFDLIVTGHNHKSFVIEQSGRLLVNPGSMMRMSKNQINHPPCVYLWFSDQNKVEPVFLPIEKNVFAIEKIKEEKEKEKKMNAFVSSLKDEYEITLSFEKNLESHFKKNKIRNPVKDLIWRSLEEKFGETLTYT